MATKAAKSITINATKYQLANTLAVVDGKIQLKADDVVLSEVTAPGGDPEIQEIVLPSGTTSLNQIGSDVQVTYKTGSSWADLIAACQADKVVYLKIYNSYNSVVGFIPVSYSERFAMDMLTPYVDFVACKGMRFHLDEDGYLTKVT